MRRVTRSLGVVLIAASVGFAGASPASAVTVSTCLARKLGDVGRTAAADLACHARAAAKPDAIALAACLGRSERRFTGGDDPSRGLFAKRERRPPCPTVGDQSALAADVADATTTLAADVGNDGAMSRCDAAKLTCLGRYVTGLSGCLSRAATGTGVVDATCLAKQTARLGDDGAGCFGKAVAKDDCSGGASSASLAATARAFVAATLCALDPNGTTECGALPTPVPTPTRTATPVATRTPTPVPSGSNGDASQICVDIINQYRASIGRPALARWTNAESCVEDQGFADMQSGQPHSAFGQCSEWAQNECPGWPGPPDQMIDDCLAAMWAEGPGEPYSQHGHYINMANPSYTMVACGFAVRSDGRVWAIQDFR
jgi:hypothetical protein